jgi:inosine-uridine nucleoside N-ribohydrolase
MKRLLATLFVSAAMAAAGADPTAGNPRRVILDVDPGIDDAMALLLAMQSPELKIEAVTVVSGNVAVDVGAENALKLVELAGRTDIPVAKGAKRPLLRELTTATSVHGDNGLGGVELPAPRKQLDPRHAVDLIIEIVNANPGEITLVPVGPLTNIALALIKEPEIRAKIPEIILMGGSVVGGNVTPAAEFNIHSDAEAAKVVFNSGIPITMVGLGATSQTVLRRPDLAELRNSGSPIAKAIAGMAGFYIRVYESRGRPGAFLHDPLAVGMAIDKSLATKMQPMRVDIETKGEFTYGMTVANRTLRVAGKTVQPNAEVPLVVDGERFVRMFLDRVKAQ